MFVKKKELNNNFNITATFSTFNIKNPFEELEKSIKKITAMPNVLTSINADFNRLISYIKSPIFLARLLIEAIYDKDEKVIMRVLEDKNFGLEVLQFMLDLARMPENKSAALLESEYEKIKLCLQETQKKLEKVESGPSQRIDAIDKKKFTDWVIRNSKIDESSRIFIRNRSDLKLLVSQHCELSKPGGYTSEVLGRWYKAALPGATFQTGRTKNK